MAGLLADVFSYGDGLKRRLGGLLSDPMGTIDLGARRFNEDQDKLQQQAQDAGFLPGSRSVLQRPQDREQARRQFAENALDTYGGLLGATVWHGSPHKFDKFDSKKIGTGEGAQAYGHGLYLAESPDVARTYKEALSGSSKNKFTLGNSEFSSTGGTPAWLEFHKIAKTQGASDEASALAWHKIRQHKGDLDAAAGELGWMENALPVHNDAANLIRKVGYKPEGGALYKVDLPDNAIAKMLDWDKPLSQQAPEVLRKVKELEKFGTSVTDADWSSRFFSPESFGDMTGAGAVGVLQKRLGQDGASEFLKKQGIPGIRYLDGGSRGAGQGTSNYVVFPGNEGLLQILERNGQALK